MIERINNDTLTYAFDTVTEIRPLDILIIVVPEELRVSFELNTNSKCPEFMLVNGSITNIY